MTIKRKRRLKLGAVGKVFGAIAMIFFSVIVVIQIVEQINVMRATQKEIARREKIQAIYEATVGDLEEQKNNLSDPNYIEVMYRCKYSMIKKGEMIFDLSGLNTGDE